MWIPNLIAWFLLNMLNPWVIWTGGLIAHFQGAVSATICLLYKPDIRHAVLSNFVQCKRQSHVVDDAAGTTTTSSNKVVIRTPHHHHQQQQQQHQWNDLATQTSSYNFVDELSTTNTASFSLGSSSAIMASSSLAVVVMPNSRLDVVGESENDDHDLPPTKKHNDDDDDNEDEEQPPPQPHPPTPLGDS